MHTKCTHTQSYTFTHPKLDVVHTTEPSVCGRDEQDAGLCHIRFRSFLQARPNRRSEGAAVPNRSGPDHRRVARAAVRRGRRWSGRWKRVPSARPNYFPTPPFLVPCSNYLCIHKNKSICTPKPIPHHPQTRTFTKPEKYSPRKSIINKMGIHKQKPPSCLIDKINDRTLLKPTISSKAISRDMRTSKLDIDLFISLTIIPTIIIYTSFIHHNQHISG